MNILRIYNKYHLPENLQMHMLRVAACSNLIIDNWNEPDIEKQAIIRVCLLHDMGNMVKIQENESKDVEFLKIRKKYFDKYGTNDHEINLEIGKQEGLTEKELTILKANGVMFDEFIVLLNLDQIFKIFISLVGVLILSWIIQIQYLEMIVILGIIYGLSLLCSVILSCVMVKNLNPEKIFRN